MIKTNNIGNYAKQAFMWDLSSVNAANIAQENEFWCEYAKIYGQNVMIPMCAVGTKGAYLAERGFCVVGFDITHEMVEEGKRRYGGLKNLALLQGDIRNFCFDVKPVDFCFCVDFGHLHTMDDIREALRCIGRHMRKGGGLIIATDLRVRGESSKRCPKKRFDFGEVLPGVRVWKINADECRYEAESGRFFIMQEVFVEDVKSGEVEVFDHVFYLQNYYRSEWIDVLCECGFEIAGEYKNLKKGLWQEGDDFWIVETVKK